MLDMANYNFAAEMRSRFDSRVGKGSMDLFSPKVRCVSPLAWRTFSKEGPTGACAEHERKLLP
jgi:hypothetical protein